MSEMSLPADWTIVGGPGAGVVTFPAGGLTETTTVTGLLRGPDATVLVLTDATPFHPGDPFWPDQPEDRGALDRAGHQAPVLGAVTVALLPTGVVEVDTGITAGRADRDVVFVVGHRVAEADAPELDDRVTLTVDHQRRRALSAAHTACHLVAFALNRVLDTAGLWKKDPTTDSLGHRDFDKTANTASQHFSGGTAVDRYRLGKSLRKQFDVAGLLGNLDAAVARVNAVLDGWIAEAALVRILAAGPRLADRRTWTCELPDGTAQMSCGGTHLDNLGRLANAAIEAAVSADGTELTITTRTRLAS